jgi:hypothetical protein
MIHDLTDTISDHPYISGLAVMVLVVSFIYMLTRKPKTPKQ